MTPIQQKTRALTALWYQLVCQDHHKDRDCHWTIESAYSYGNEPTFTVQHYGYVHREISRECASYLEAEVALLEELSKAFKEQFEDAASRAADGEVYDTDPNVLLALKPEFERIVADTYSAEPPAPQGTWNAALEEAIDLVRDVLREEGSALTYEAADAMQQRLREKLHAR